MPEPETTSEAQTRPEQRQQQTLSEELVRQVADRVYMMLMQDLAIERERQRPSSIGVVWPLGERSRR
jgi:hypothetical protein